MRWENHFRRQLHPFVPPHSHFPHHPQTPAPNHMTNHIPSHHNHQVAKDVVTIITQSFPAFCPRTPLPPPPPSFFISPHLSSLPITPSTLTTWERCDIEFCSNAAQNVHTEAKQNNNNKNTTVPFPTPSCILTPISLDINPCRVPWTIIINRKESMIIYYQSHSLVPINSFFPHKDPLRTHPHPFQTILMH